MQKFENFCLFRNPSIRHLLTPETWLMATENDGLARAKCGKNWNEADSLTLLETYQYVHSMKHSNVVKAFNAWLNITYHRV